MTPPSNDPSGEAPRQGSAAGMGPLELQSLNDAKRTGSLALGCIGGVAAAIAGAILWAAIAVVTNRQIGWTAIGVAFLVGKAVRLLGKGTRRTYGLVAAVLSVLGSLAGNLLTVAAMISREEAVPLAEVLWFFATSPADTAQALILTFQPADLLFYGIAACAGYWFACGGTAEARTARTQRPSPPQPAVAAGSPMPSFFRVLQKDTVSGCLFLPTVSLWICWLLASIGILPGRAGLRGDVWANLPSIQRWFLIGAIAVSAVCVPLLLRRLLVIRGVFGHLAEVDGQVVHVPPRAAWKTLIIEYYYHGEKHRIGYTVPADSHPDLQLQVGDGVRLLVNERRPRHAIPLSMFG